MSTGHDCRIYEKTPARWFYDLETYTRGEYETEGPFSIYKDAIDHLNRNHANPGGYSITALPGCKHDLARPVEHRMQGESTTHYCDRCGAHLDLRDVDSRRKEAWENVLERETANLILSVLANTGLSKAQEQVLTRLGVPKENIDKALGRAAYWWKGIQSRLDWQGTTEKITAALTAALTDKPVSLVPTDNHDYLRFKYRAPQYDRPDPSKDAISRIRQDFAVQIDWFGETINIHSL
jgi:hypothetical protein